MGTGDGPSAWDRSGRDNRRFVYGVLWGLRSGAHWHDLPERYGKWKSVHTRFSRRAKAGVWERVFKALIRDHANQYLMLDTTLVRAHQQAARSSFRTTARSINCATGSNYASTSSSISAGSQPASTASTPASSLSSISPQQ